MADGGYGKGRSCRDVRSGDNTGLPLTSLAGARSICHLGCFIVSIEVLSHSVCTLKCRLLDDCLGKNVCLAHLFLWSRVGHFPYIHTGLRGLCFHQEPMSYRMPLLSGCIS